MTVSRHANATYAYLRRAEEMQRARIAKRDGKLSIIVRMYVRSARAWNRILRVIEP